MENEMIERAVNAVMAIEFASALPGTHLSRDGARKVVLATVEAMREPTADMSFAGGGTEVQALRQVQGEGRIIVGMENANAVFAAMIDAALTPSGPRNPR